MAKELEGCRVAILVENGFEQVELAEPRKALDQAGASTEIVSPVSGEVKGWSFTDWGDNFPVDTPLDRARPDRYDALLLPGGVMNPDKLRMNPTAVQFVKGFFMEDKPVAAICHGPWMLVEAGVLRGRVLTSWPSLRTDIQNSGGDWTDRECVVDENLVTSRKPDDIPVFNREMVRLFSSKRSG